MPSEEVQTKLNERNYRIKIKELLLTIYPKVEISWYPFRGYGRSMYNPEIDIAVGPFAIQQQYRSAYNELLDVSSNFLKYLVLSHNENIESDGEKVIFENIRSFNENARCFLCIEIEDSGSRKHCLGDLINASALGRVGLLVARSDKILKIFLRQRVYLKHLGELGKNTFKLDNTLIVTEQQLSDYFSKINVN